jgi:hypothetical protein
MPNFSNISLPSDLSTDEDIPGYLSGTGAQELWPASSSPLKKLYAPADRNHDAPFFSRSDSRAMNGSQYSGHAALSRRSSSGSAGSHNHPLRARASNDRGSYIYVSSDHPEANDNEIVELRKENTMLKVECGQLQGQITGLK